MAEFSVPVLILALLVNGVFAYSVMLRGLVDYSGAAAGGIIGAAVMAGGGLWFWLMLVFFFGSSSFFSSVGRRRKQGLKHLHQKGSRRDAAQVLANGSAAAAALLCYGIFATEVLALLAAAALTSAAADTWAGELGMLSRKQPVSILTWRPVERGLSGGITGFGVLCSLAGAGGTSLFFFLNRIGTEGAVTASAVQLTGIAVLAGVCSALTDSFLGAALQAHYIDDDGQITERSTSPQGEPLQLFRGISWISNDMVNFLSILAGMGYALVLYLLL